MSRYRYCGRGTRPASAGDCSELFPAGCQGDGTKTVFRITTNIMQKLAPADFLLPTQQRNSNALDPSPYKVDTEQQRMISLKNKETDP